MRMKISDWDKSILKRILHYLAPYRGQMILLIVFNLTANVLMLSGPRLSGKAIDAIGMIRGSSDYRSVLFYCCIMLAFYIISAILSFLVSWIMIRTGKDIACRMRREIQEKLLRLPVSYFDTRQIGDIISSISYDVDTVNASLTSDFVQIITSVMTLFFSLGMMLSLSFPLVFVFGVTLPISVFIVKHRLKITRPLFQKRTKMLGELNGYTEDVLSGLFTIKGYHQEQSMIDQFSRKNNQTSDAYYQAECKGSIAGPAMTFMNNLSLALLGIFGALLYMGKSITVGNLSAFILYSRKFVGPVNELTNILSELQSAFSAANRIFALLDEPEEKDREDAVPLESAAQPVSFDHVSFGYTPDKPILKDLQLQADRGKVIAVVGATGAGKSTIIHLLMRFYKPQKGRIRIGGQDIADVRLESLRRAFSMVLQDTWIFQGTILENIQYGSPDASMEEVIQAAKDTHIDDFIETLPEGYHTVISDNGSNLSKGQKQLITIARAMLRRTAILILDEATSNVDSRTELFIQEALLRLMKGKTSFVIAHRLSTVRHADCILVLDHGEIAEQGTHEELLKRKGIYAALYQLQFE